jgi:hypothetical protein
MNLPAQTYDYFNITFGGGGTPPTELAAWQAVMTSHFIPLIVICDENVPGGDTEFDPNPEFETVTTNDVIFTPGDVLVAGDYSEYYIYSSAGGEYIVFGDGAVEYENLSIFVRGSSMEAPVKLVNPPMTSGQFTMPSSWNIQMDSFHIAYNYETNLRLYFQGTKSLSDAEWEAQVEANFIPKVEFYGAPTASDVFSFGSCPGGLAVTRDGNSILHILWNPETGTADFYFNGTIHAGNE